MPWIRGSPCCSSSPKSSTLSSPGVVEGDSPDLSAQARSVELRSQEKRKPRPMIRRALSSRVHARPNLARGQCHIPQTNLRDTAKKRPPTRVLPQEEVDVAYERLRAARSHLDAVAEDAHVTLQVRRVRCRCRALLKLQRKVRPHVDLDRRRVEGISSTVVDAEKQLATIAKHAVQPLPITVVVDAEHGLSTRTHSSIVHDSPPARPSSCGPVLPSRIESPARSAAALPDTERPTTFFTALRSASSACGRSHQRKSQDQEGEVRACGEASRSSRSGIRSAVGSARASV
eukprot:scaffold30101_cov73-Phaeocystis_antarctica.AAC.2